MIFEFQMSASSLRQLSILGEPACAAASPATNAATAIPPRFQATSILMLPSSFASFMPAFALNLSPASDHRHIPTAISGSKTASIPLANLLSSIMGQVYTSCLAACAESEAGGMPELRPSGAERTPLFEAIGAAL